jgi:hypothetical protein
MNNEFPYVSYKGKKYTDPHAAAKAFLLDADKNTNDTLNIHDISHTSHIDGAGIDPNGKIWTNNYSFQNHSQLLNLKSAMKDVFDSIKEVMLKNNMTLEQVAAQPINVRPFYSYDGKRYGSPEEALSNFHNDTEKQPNQTGVVYHDKYDTGGIQLTGVNENNESWFTQLSDYKDKAVVKESFEIYERLKNTTPETTTEHVIETPVLPKKIEASIDLAVNELNNNNVPSEDVNAEIIRAVTAQPEFPYFKYDNKIYQSADEVMKVFINDRDNKSIKSDIALHLDNHFMSVDAAGHDINGNIWKNQYSFQDNPAMKDFKKAFDNQVNSYKADLIYLDDVYADTAKVVEGYPVSVQIKDMNELKKIIDKLPIHNISDSDMIKINSYKNDIKNHELSVFLDKEPSNKDIKIQNINTLKIS